MYGSGIHKAFIDAYGLLENEYDNYLCEIDSERLLQLEIKYDEEWINNIYLPRFRYLEKCLEDGRFPTEEDFKNE